MEVDLATLKQCGKYFADFLEEREEAPEEEFDLSEFSITKKVFEHVLEFTRLCQEHRAPLIKKPLRHKSMYNVTTPAFAKYAE